VPRRTVVTVHGINSDGDWQGRVKSVLEPHFRCETVRYYDYRRRGELKLVLDLRAAVVAAAAVSLLAWTQAIPEPWWQATALLVGIAPFVLAQLRRARVLRQFKSQLDPLLGQANRIHVIGHSYGTYLIGAALKKFPDVRLRRVVLAGCVLPVTYPWRRCWIRNRWAYVEVRNEVGGRDLAVWFVFLLRNLVPGLLPGLGYSGSLGFLGNRDFIHRLSNPYGPCHKCEASEEPGRVHDVKIREIAHSDLFIGRSHTRTFWLPFLWGIIPDEYQDWLDSCEVAATLEEETDFPRLREMERELRKREWRWCGDSVSLERYVQGHLIERQRARGAEGIPDELLDETIRLVWRSVDAARVREDMLDDGGTPTDPAGLDRRRALDPRIAVARAVDAILS
jgi:pimeloyl-ACP methyl ester carboxylesterase